MRFRKIRITQPLMILLLNKALSGRLPDRTVVTGVKIGDDMNLEFVLYSEQFKRVLETSRIPFVEESMLEALLETELDRG